MKSQPNSESDIKRAHSLAKSGQIEEALSLASNINRDGMQADDIRKLALTYSYCRDDIRSEEAWILLRQRGYSKPGDWFMLGSMQARMGKASAAIDNLFCEIENYKHSNDATYFVSSGIVLAQLLINAGRFSEAQSVLNLMAPEDSYYIHGMGVLTAATLRSQLK